MTAVADTGDLPQLEHPEVRSTRPSVDWPIAIVAGDAPRRAYAAGR